MAIDPERHLRLVDAVRASPFDALICDSASEVLLLTGFWPVAGASVVVFTSEGEVNLIVPEDEAELAAKSSSAHLVPYKPAGLHTLSPPLDLLSEPLLSIIRTIPIRSCIGFQHREYVQPAPYAVSYHFRSSLIELLKSAKLDPSFVACDDLLESLKPVKTTVEIRLMQHACRLASAGFAAAQTCIQPGASENQVAAAVQSAFDAAPSGGKVQRSYGYFFCMSGPNSAKADAAYARTRQRVIEHGDLVMIHANTCADGYWTDITRTYSAGEPSQRQRDLRLAIDQACNAALSAIRPGLVASEVDKAARDTMKAHGFGEQFHHATGHGVGFASANPNGLPRIHPLSQDVLEQGMTFNIEPAAYFADWGGMRHCDMVEVTEDGARVMTDF